MVLEQAVPIPLLLSLRKNQHLGSFTRLGSLPTLSFEKEGWGKTFYETFPRSHCLGFTMTRLEGSSIKECFEQWEKNTLKMS